jgi:F1F0 ATPase subunit 2
MNWFAAITTGFGVGVLSFGGLWLTVREATFNPQRAAWVWAGQLLRLALVGLVFYGLVLEGPDKLLEGLAGLWLARWCLVRQLGAGAASPLEALDGR